MLEINNNEFEDLDEPDEETIKALEIIGKLTEAAVKALKNKPDDTIIRFTCPICGKTAITQRSSYNGHIHATCEHCNIAFME